MGITYRDAGVDIDEGDRLVELIKPLAKRTMRPEVVAGIGGFGGLFAMDLSKWKKPVLVSGTDGVGTKLKLAFMTGKHETVGIDLVAMSVNDVAVCGAEPLFFLDYYATSKLHADVAKNVIAGIAEGCAQAGCTLLGGETAELPGFYQGDEYDLAGFAVGCVERDAIIDGTKTKAGDQVIGVASSGLHSNGFSLARKVLLEHAGLELDAHVPELGKTLGDALLTPTIIYAKQMLALAKAVPVKGFAHITGGGLPGNLPRCIPDGLKAVLQSGSWPEPAIFALIAKLGSVARDEMLRTLNMGIGLCTIVAPEHVDAALASLKQSGLSAWRVGEIAPGSGEATAEVV
ncbi:MAG: phosphoribosylformylglycinamidine cyclo-ligase [Deltaproteobacteria bacterium]|nr:phosphoribosylformylglycinamidine cyclo-ligase [Deltaproteobacteria bacterium]